jgi:thioredoxin 1
MTETATPLDRLPEIADAVSLMSLINDPARPALVLFAVGGHGPAQRQEERLLRLPQAGTAVNLARVDVDRLQEVAQTYGVKGAPALVLFRSGQAVAQRLGEIADDDLLDWIESELAT